MANYRQAPELEHNGDKNLKKDKYFYQYPMALADIVFRELGNSSAQLRIMLVLIGTAPGFKVSEQWILDRTGLVQSSYSRARTALIEKGWITLDEAKTIAVNFNEIYKA